MVELAFLSRGFQTFIEKRVVIADRYGPAVGVGFGLAMSAVSLPIYVRLFKKNF